MRQATSPRSTRLSDQIMREIATMLLEEVADPRLNLVTISGAKLNADLSIAEVYYTMSGDAKRIHDVETALERAKGFLRSRLGKRLKLRLTPELRFLRDEFLETMVYGRQAGSD